MSETAVVDRALRLSYAELEARTNGLAHVLQDLGAAPAARVAALLPNCLEYFETGLAAAKVRCAFIPVNWHLKAEELGYVLADSGAAVLVADPALAEYVEAAREQHPNCAVVWRGVEYDELIAAAGTAPLEDAWRTPAWMFYTSGTTGRPKGVVHGEPDGSVMAMAQDGLIAMWGFRGDDVHLLSGPGYHAGPGGYAFMHLYAGATVVVLPEWDAAEWCRLVEQERVTTTFLTPAHLIRLLEMDLDAYDLGTLRHVIHAGAPCPEPVKRRFLDALPACDVAELYGASEGGVTRISRAEWLARPGSVGQPWPGVGVRIADADDPSRLLPTGADGVIWVTPAGGRTFWYHGDDAKTHEAWHDGAFTVGDVGHLDEDGYLYVTDRISDLVLWGGVNIYPREIEEVLHTHPAVVDCAVLGVPDERHGEVLKAIVELRAPATADELREHVRARLADFKVPTYVDVVDTLPRDPNGKVLKRRLKETS